MLIANVHAFKFYFIGPRACKLHFLSGSLRKPTCCCSSPAMATIDVRAIRARMTVKAVVICGYIVPIAAAAALMREADESGAHSRVQRVAAAREAA